MVAQNLLGFSGIFLTLLEQRNCSLGVRLQEEGVRINKRRVMLRNTDNEN